jgi:FAD/FMN-containing dehydrogenase
MTTPIPDSVLNALKALLGEGGWSQDVDRLAPKLIEWRGRWPGHTPLLVLPRNTDEVSQIVRLCAEAGVAITPQGGNTGLVGGQIPQGEILLSLEKMRTVREVETFDDVIVVEAGVTLSAVHEAAQAAGRHFPLSLASEGSATIGGLVSTNAGGTAVLRYGPMRDLVLGLEAVLPDGRIWHGLKRLRKDNTGYDLKQLLIGAEGTLGIVTAASLKLFPILPSRATAMVGLSSPHAAIALLALAKEQTGGAVEAFELMGRLGVSLALKNIPGLREPLGQVQDWYVLIETASGEPGAAEAALERLLAMALDQALIADAVLAQDQTQAKALWAIRESQSAAQRPEGVAWKHDVSVPVSQVAAFIDEANAAVTAMVPACRIVAFGHVGDGNVHYDVIVPEGGDGEAHAALRDQGAKTVHDIVARRGGSISAEHGLGTMKSVEALRYKSDLEVETLRAIRLAMDPKRILNPRVLF